MGFPSISAGKESTAMQDTWVPSLGWEDPLETGLATHSSILVWRIPWTVYSWGHKELDMTEQLHFDILSIKLNYKYLEFKNH